jgi:hypothetical protein
MTLTETETELDELAELPRNGEITFREWLSARKPLLVSMTAEN